MCLSDLDEVLLELEEDVEGMQNTILLMQRELKVEKERNQSVERENGRMLTVLRDKPEWLAAVQARQEEAAAALAAADRLKMEQDGGERRLNGGGCVGGMDVDDQEGEEISGSAEPMDTATTTTTQNVEAMALRTRSGGVQVEGGSRTTATGGGGVDDEDQVVVGDLVATNGKAEVNNICISGINNNGQSMMMATRKRTRSSVAVVPSAKSVVVANCGEEAALEQEDLMPSVEEEVSTNCGVSVGKRNRYNNSNSDQQQSKSAPRTRGQLLQMNESEKAVPTKLGDGEEVMMMDGGLVENGGGGGGEAGGAAEVKKTATSEHVLFCGSNNNNNTSISNNGSSNKEAAEGVDENGTGVAPAPGASVEAMKLKLENGGAAAAGGIDLRQENTSA